MDVHSNGYVLTSILKFYLNSKRFYHKIEHKLRACLILKVKFEVMQLERRIFILNRLEIIHRTIGGGSSLEFQMWQEICLWATLYIHSLLGILFKRLLKMMIISIYAYIAAKFSIYFLIVFHDQFFMSWTQVSTPDGWQVGSSPERVRLCCKRKSHPEELPVFCRYFFSPHPGKQTT